jgi:hypothetical protein
MPPIDLPVAVIHPSVYKGWIKWVRTHIFPQSSLAEINTSKEFVVALTNEAARESIKFKRTSAIWGTAHITLGLPAVALGAVAAAIALAAPTWQIPAAVMSFISAGLVAGLVFLGSEARQTRARSLYKAWTDYEAECLLVVTTFEREEDSKEIEAKLRKLIEMRKEILREAAH